MSRFSQSGVKSNTCTLWELSALKKQVKSTLLNALYEVDAPCGDSANVHMTSGIQLYVKEGLAIFDSEGATSADKRAQLNKDTARKHVSLVKTFRKNIESALMAVLVAVCNPVIYIFTDPNGSDDLLEVISAAAGKLEMNDRSNRQLIACARKPPLIRCLLPASKYYQR